MDPLETVTTTTKKVKCSGERGALGHPLVYLDMGSGSRIMCPYCGKVFIFREITKPQASIERDFTNPSSMNHISALDKSNH